MCGDLPYRRRESRALSSLMLGFYTQLDMPGQLREKIIEAGGVSGNGLTPARLHVRGQEPIAKTLHCNFLLVTVMAFPATFSSGVGPCFRNHYLRAEDGEVFCLFIFTSNRK